MVDLSPEDLEELRQAANLAEMLVRGELRLAKLQRCNAPEKIIELETGRVLEFQEKVEKDLFAKEFLPQIRRLVGIQNARHAYFRTQTVLGKLEALVDEYCERNLLGEADSVLDGSEQEMLDQFTKTVATGDAKKILWDLGQILSRARFNLEMATDVPPPPPQLQITPGQKFVLNIGNFLKDEDEEG
jgi:hypothetical protein